MSSSLRVLLPLQHPDVPFLLPLHDALPIFIYHRPANRFVAGFVGSPTMNFSAGRIGDGGAAFEGEGLRVPLGGYRWLRSEEHSLNSSHLVISYAVFCLKKKRVLSHDYPLYY